MLGRRAERILDQLVKGRINLDAGLLKHDLGQPDPIDVVRLPPREVAVGSIVPAKKRTRHTISI